LGSANARLVRKLNSISKKFLEVVAEAPDREAMIFEDLSMSYADLRGVVSSFRSKLSVAEVCSTSFIVVDSEDPLVVIATAIAAASLGAKYGNNHSDIDQLTKFEPTHYFHDVESAKDAKDGSLCIDVSWAAFDRASEPQGWGEYEIASTDNPWLIVHTSGSTGLPKFLGLSQQTVLARSAAASDEFVGGQTRFVSLFSATARPFLSRAFAAILNGATLVFSGLPEFWIKADVNFVMGSPLQVQSRLSGLELPRKIALLHIGGGRSEDALIIELLSSFEVVVDAYGASETNHSFNNIKKLDSVGNLVTIGQKRDSLIEVVDRNGRPCERFDLGYVKVKNAYLASGYLNNEAAEKLCFRDGWFYPGDLAHWGEDGQLVLEGREDHVINLGGVKANALAVDQIMRETDGISDAICFKNPKEGALNELLAFAVFDGNVSQLQAESSAKFALQSRLGDMMVPKHIRPINFVPRKESGAPDRDQCAELVLTMAAKRSG
jgi:acyl-coenzyme A synthetase/AMP-(fatty) acid ligase